MNKVAFKAAIAYLVILATLGLLSGLLGGFFEIQDGEEGFLVVLSFFLACYLTMRFFLFRYLNSEGFVVLADASEGDSAVESRRWPLYWGFGWRLLVLGMVSNWLSTSLFLHAVPLGLAGQLVLVTFLVYLAIQWLLRQPYGRLRIVPRQLLTSLTDSDCAEFGTVPEPSIGVRVKDHFASLFGGVLGLLFLTLYGLMAVGELYWLWMSFKIGSFWMFVFGLFPPTMLVASVVGAYGLIFELPYWVYELFG